MTTLRPRIAIPEPTSTDAEYNQRSMPQYIHAIEATGGTAVPIHLLETLDEQAAALKTCSGILLPGSPADVDPSRYGQSPVEACAAKDAPREATDDLLLHEAFHQGKPLLGICFGLQSLNVWRHGTLIQDLPQANPSAAKSENPKSRDAEPVNHQPGREVLHAHPVSVTPNSRLSQLLSSVDEVDLPVLLVNSSHHQAIDQPGEMLTVAARSSRDGVIEALEVPDPESFVLAVQWHPERSYEQSAASRAIFSSFLEAATAWELEAQRSADLAEQAPSL